jgi:very-short-patch-repair endonuclease
MEKALIVELDGGQHAERQEADQGRTDFLEQQGYRVIRFWNDEVFKNLEGVLEIIRLNLER